MALYEGSDYTVEAQHTKTPPKFGGAAVVAIVDLLHRGIGEMNYDYDLMSFQTAKKRGLAGYFIGKPCPRGHVCERFVSTRGCVLCVKENKSTEKGRASENAGRRRKYTSDPVKIKERNKLYGD